MNTDRFHMLIKVDSREPALMSICASLVQSYNLSEKLSVTSCQLPLGDVAIYSEEKLVLLIERKSLSDLTASISDGRYAEQSFRLNECDLPNHDIIYMIEGNLENYTPRFGRVDRAAIYSSIVSLQCFKGFSIIRSNSIHESGEYVVRFANKLLKGGIDKMHSAPGDVKPRVYTDTLRQKKAFIEPSNIHTLWLSQIPGVSTNVAEILLNKFGSIWQLRDALASDPSCLSGLSMKTKTGQTRAISKRTMNDIKAYLSWEYTETS